MNQRPQVSDEEIKNFMDFRGVLNQHDQQIRMIKRNSLIKKIVVSSIAIVALVAIFWIVQTTEQPVVQQQQEQAKIDRVVEPEASKEETKSVSEETTEPTQLAPSTKSTVTAKNENSKPEQTSPQVVVEEEKSPEESNYVQAEPAKGYQELYDYFAKNLIYPQEMMKDSIQGTSTVSFIIDKEGNPGKIEVINSLGPAFDKEIARLIESMPDWKPASLNNKPVPSRISLPFTFQLQKMKSK